MNKADLIKSLCQFVESGNKASGNELIKHQYPFKKIEYVKRSYSKALMLRVFMKDGFIDRYSGQKLIFPPVLRILSMSYPEEFPFHPNWKMSECHPAYWDLLPTIDHIIPIAKGGDNTEENLVSTSMMRNSAKSNFTLEELGWQLHSPGKIENWDGQVSWFIEIVEKHPEYLNIRYIKEWFVVLKKHIKITEL
ncbi:HNH endonuclease [Fictibacillus sp. NPDC058756]|uniref:HNH endonuclease n=1 Tax=Fictibacillus sp. NPDC058756 TaxID=3346625 RepID=UPI00369A1F31